MVKQVIPTMKVLVAGDPGNGKANFIKRFLNYYPPSAEIRRKNDSIHFTYIPDKNYKIQLCDVSNTVTIKHRFCDDVDVVFFCYAANDPQSFLSLEKWIQSVTSEKKATPSFLVADISNIGSQRNVAEHLAEQARELKERFCIKRFIESSFDDNESTYSTFQSILNEISLSKLNGSFSMLNKKFPDVCLKDEFPKGFLARHRQNISSRLSELGAKEILRRYSGTRIFQRDFSNSSQALID